MVYQVRMRTLLAGPIGVFRPGEIFEGSETECEQLVNGRYAEWVDIPIVVENKTAAIETTAVEPRDELAVRRRGRPRKL